MAQQKKRMCLKLSAVVASANFQQKRKLVDFKVKSKQEALEKL
jgi:hypothetical protein